MVISYLLISNLKHTLLCSRLGLQHKLPRRCTLVRSELPSINVEVSQISPSPVVVRASGVVEVAVVVVVVVLLLLLVVIVMVVSMKSSKRRTSSGIVLYSIFLLRLFFITSQLFPSYYLQVSLLPSSPNVFVSPLLP